MSAAPSPVTLAVLAFAVLVAAVAVVHNKQTLRQLTHENDQQRAERQRLDQEWAQLQLEEAALASHARVESAARARGMAEPSRVVIVQPQPSGTP